MTAVESTGRAVALDGTTALGRAPWPFVERRAHSRSGQVTVVAGAWPDAVPAQRTGAPPAVPLPRSTRAGDASWERRSVAGLVLWDVGAAVLAASWASGVRFGGTPGAGQAYTWGLVALPAAWVLALALARGYEVRTTDGSTSRTQVLDAALGLAVSVAVGSFLLGLPLSGDYTLLLLPALVLLSVTGRSLLRWGLERARASGRWRQDVLLVGDESSVLVLAHQFRLTPRSPVHVLGACVPGGASARLDALAVPVLGDVHQAARVAVDAGAGAVAVTTCPDVHGPQLRRLSWELEGSGVELAVAAGLLEVGGPRLRMRTTSGVPLLHVAEPELLGCRRLVKEAVDRTGALVGLVLTLPLFLAVAVLERLLDGGPVFYVQTRVGRHGRAFRLVKFRSMHVGADRHRGELQPHNERADGLLFKMRDDPRVTRLGRWLRRSSVDELPQLWNVLRGDMSLVGPRPPLPDEVERYGDDLHRRLLVKPGITGLWQVSGRSSLTWEQSVRLDLRYVENWSLTLDALILLRTVGAVLTGRGAY